MRSLCFLICGLMTSLGLGASESTPDCSESVKYKLPELEGKNLTQVETDKRPAYLYVPTKFNNTNETVPLVVVLHGYSMNPGDMVDLYKAGLNANNYFFLLPEGTRDSDGCRAWRGRSCCGNWGDSGHDDIKYINNLVDTVTATYDRIDPSRIHLVGFSNGGWISMDLACAKDNKFAAAVNLVGSMTTNVASCRPGRAVSVLIVHGTEDEVVAYDGGKFDVKGFEDPGAYLSAPDVAKTWATINKCTNLNAKEQSEKFNMEEGKGKDTTRFVYEGCPSGVKVELWKVDGGKHVPNLNDKSKGVIQTFDFLQDIRKSNETTGTMENSDFSNKSSFFAFNPFALAVSIVVAIFHVLVL